MDCLKPEPFVFLEPSSNDEVESFETKDNVEDWGLKPGLFGVVEGARWLERRGSGEYGRLWC